MSQKNSQISVLILILSAIAIWKLPLILAVFARSIYFLSLLWRFFLPLVLVFGSIGFFCHYGDNRFAVKVKKSPVLRRFVRIGSKTNIEYVIPLFVPVVNPHPLLLRMLLPFLPSQSSWPITVVELQSDPQEGTTIVKRKLTLAEIDLITDSDGKVPRVNALIELSPIVKRMYAVVDQIKEINQDIKGLKHLIALTENSEIYLTEHNTYIELKERLYEILITSEEVIIQARKLISEALIRAEILSSKFSTTYGLPEVSEQQLEMQLQLERIRDKYDEFVDEAKIYSQLGNEDMLK